MNNCWVHYSYNCFKGNAVRIFWCVGFLFSKENADTYQKRSLKRCKSTNMYSFLVWSVQYWNSTAAGDGDGWNYASQSTQKVDTVYTNKFPSSLRVKGKGSISACPLSQVSFFPWLSWYHTVHPASAEIRCTEIGPLGLCVQGWWTKHWLMANREVQL